MFSFSPSSTFSDRLDVVASAPLGPFSILYTLRLSSCRSDLPFIPHVERHFGADIPGASFRGNKALSSTPAKPLTCETLVQQRSYLLFFLLPRLYEHDGTSRSRCERVMPRHKCIRGTENELRPPAGNLSTGMHSLCYAPSPSLKAGR